MPTETEERDDTFWIPTDFPGADQLKEGDTITLRVVGRDGNGEVEVELAGGPEQETDWKTDLKNEAPDMGLETE